MYKKYLNSAHRLNVNSDNNINTENIKMGHCLMTDLTVLSLNTIKRLLPTVMTLLWKAVSHSSSGNRKGTVTSCRVDSTGNTQRGSSLVDASHSCRDSMSAVRWSSSANGGLSPCWQWYTSTGSRNVISRGTPSHASHVEVGTHVHTCVAQAKTSCVPQYLRPTAVFLRDEQEWNASWRLNDFQACSHLVIVVNY